MMDRIQAEGFINGIGKPLGFGVKEPARLTADGVAQVQAAINYIDHEALPKAEASLEAAYSSTKQWIEGKRPDRKDGYPPRRWPGMWDKWEKTIGASLRAQIDGLKAKRVYLVNVLEEHAQVQEAKAKAKAKAKGEDLERMAEEFPGAVRSVTNTAKNKGGLIKAALALADALKGESLESALQPVLGITARRKDLEAQRHFLVSNGYQVEDVPAVETPEGLRQAVETILGRKLDPPARSRKWERIGAEMKAAEADAAVLAKK